MMKGETMSGEEAAVRAGAGAVRCGAALRRCRVPNDFVWRGLAVPASLSSIVGRRALEV